MAIADTATGVDDPVPRGELDFNRPAEDTLCVRLAGSWRSQDGLPPAAEVVKQLEVEPRAQHVTFDVQSLSAWDSGLLTFLINIIDYGKDHQIEVNQDSLPDGVQRLLHLAYAVPERQGARREAVSESWLERVGKWAMAISEEAREMLAFIGEASLAFVKLFQGKARFRRSDFMLIMQECGSQALIIVSLISFLVGVILAFMGAVQLRQFGAQIFVANLVGIGMAREMGAMMTAIIMAGRTGAAFAAQLGTMTVNEEIDALKTMGFSAMEFLVLPRMLALMLMLPLLCLYSVLMGILGGLVVGVGMLDLGFIEYLNQTREGLNLTQFALGLIKATVYGVLVAIAGCLRGMQCGRSASAVGAAATSAVVTGIVLIIVSCGILTVIYDVLGV